MHQSQAKAPLIRHFTRNFAAACPCILLPTCCANPLRQRIVAPAGNVQMIGNFPLIYKTWRISGQNIYKKIQQNFKDNFCFTFLSKLI
jgi:hypothetical protein